MEPSERDVEALALVIQGGDPWIRINANVAAIEVLRSAWYAERIAEARREGAAEVAARLGLLYDNVRADALRRRGDGP